MGDIGIGTFKGLNGEMIVLDGTVYQALGDGRVVVADDKDKVPFSNVTFFDKDITVDLQDVTDKEDLKSTQLRRGDSEGKAGTRQRKMGKFAACSRKCLLQ